MTDEAVILAGGLGTRLRNVVSDIPKSMAPVNDKPFMSYLLDYLVDSGIKRVVLSVGFMHEKIMEYFNNRYKGIELAYSIENEPLGTGGALALAMKSVWADDVFVLNGDTLFNIDLIRLYDYHIKKCAHFSLALRKVEDASRYGTVVCSEFNRVTEFREKDIIPGPGLINGGIYIINKNYFNSLNLTGKFSLENDCFGKLCEASYIYGHVFDNYFIDIGIPDDFNKAQYEFKKF